MRLTRRVFLEGAGSLAAALALAACGGGDTDAGEEEVVEQEVEAATEPEEEPQPEPEEPFPTIEETVLLDTEGIKVVATNLEKRESNVGEEAALSLRLENNREAGVRMTGLAGSINGIMVYGWNNGAFDETVEAGSSVDTEMAVDLGHDEQSGLTRQNTWLGDLGIGTIANIEFYLQVHEEAAPFADVFTGGPLKLSTSAAGEYVQEYDDDGEVIYDDNGITLISKGIQDFGNDSWHSCYLVYEVINSRGEVIDIDDTGIVNGGVEDMGSELGVSVIVAPGCRHMAAGSIWGDKVQEEGVAAIESVSYTGTAQDLLTREELFTFETSPVAP